MALIPRTAAAKIKRELGEQREINRVWRYSLLKLASVTSGDDSKQSAPFTDSRINSTMTTYSFLMLCGGESCTVSIMWLTFASPYLSQITISAVDDENCCSSAEYFKSVSIILSNVNCQKIRKTPNAHNTRVTGNVAEDRHKVSSRDSN